MSIISYIEHLRTKPEHVRKRISFWSAFGITAVIGLFWMGAFSTFTNTTQSTVAQVVNRAETPAESLVASVGGFFHDVRDLIFGAKIVKFETLEVLPGSR